MNMWEVSEYNKRIKEKEKKGLKIIRMDIGEPDFETPNAIKHAALNALKKGQTRYTDPKGIFPLRKEICNNYCGKKILSPEENVIVTPGSKYAIFSALYVLLKDDKDQALFFDPYWMDYAHMCRLLRRSFNTVPLIDDTKRYYFDEEMLKEKITKNIKVLILNSPHHPTGKIFSREEVKLIVDIAEDMGIVILSDEIYDKIRFIESYYSPIDFDNSLENLVIINGVSKSCAMSGWRVGWAISSKKIIDEMTDFQIYTSRCANSIAQYAAIEALKDNEAVRKMVEEYRERSNSLYYILNGFDSIRCAKPEGTFYLFANFSSINKDGFKLVDELLDYGISALPGELFGNFWNGYIRFAVTTKMNQIMMSKNVLTEYISKNRHVNG